MASKRANAIKAAKASEAIADRMEAIERNQALIMEALNIVVPSDDEAEVEAVVADDAPSEVSDSPEGEAVVKEDTGSKPAPAKKKATSAKK